MEACSTLTHGAHQVKADVPHAHLFRPSHFSQPVACASQAAREQSHDIFDDAFDIPLPMS